MVTNETPDSRVFKAIADPTRRATFDLLRARPHSAGEVADRFPMSRPAVSRHLRVRHRASLVRETRQSQILWYALDSVPLAAVDRWLADYRVFWGARLHDLKRFVEPAQEQDR